MCRDRDLFVSSQATSANLQRSYRNVPKAASSKKDCTGICHLCLAGRPGLDYEDMYLDEFHVHFSITRDCMFHISLGDYPSTFAFSTCSLNFSRRSTPDAGLMPQHFCKRVVRRALGKRRLSLRRS